jgi:hypothetical protein
MNIFRIILKYSVDASHRFYVMKTNRLKLFREVIAVYSETHIKHVD